MKRLPRPHPAHRIYSGQGMQDVPRVNLSNSHIFLFERNPNVVIGRALCYFVSQSSPPSHHSVIPSSHHQALARQEMCPDQRSPKAQDTHKLVTPKALGMLFDDRSKPQAEKDQPNDATAAADHTTRDDAWVEKLLSMDAPCLIGP